MSRRRPRPREATEAVHRRDNEIVNAMATSELPMPLQYMEKNMHWYSDQAARYAELIRTAKKPTSFRIKKDQEKQRDLIKHYESMMIKFRALNQAAALEAANYVHARIQSVSVGNSRGSRAMTIILEGPDGHV